MNMCLAGQRHSVVVFHTKDNQIIKGEIMKLRYGKAKWCKMMHKKSSWSVEVNKIFMKNEYRCMLFHQYGCVSLIHNNAR